MAGRNNWRHSDERIAFVREHAADLTAIEIMKQLRAPNVKCIYNLAQFHQITLTAEGGPTLGCVFSQDQYERLKLAAARRGLTKEEFLRRMHGILFGANSALLNNVMDDGVTT